MTKILNDLLNLFFPKLCILCKAPLTSNEEQVCLTCLCDLPYTHFYLQENNPAEQLFIGKAPIEHATSLLFYEKGGKVQKLIHSFKYHGNKELAWLLGRQMGIALQKHFADHTIHMLIPVPLHKKRKRKRGYNQSEWICKGIASVWNIPVCADILIRISQTETQTRKSIYERWINVKEIFKVKDNQTFADKHILLVDDVMTSGSTLLACAEVLTATPDIRISILSLAIA